MNLKRYVILLTCGSLLAGQTGASKQPPNAKSNKDAVEVKPPCKSTASNGARTVCGDQGRPVRRKRRRYRESKAPLHDLDCAAENGADSRLHLRRQRVLGCKRRAESRLRQTCQDRGA